MQRNLNQAKVPKKLLLSLWALVDKYYSQARNLSCVSEGVGCTGVGAIAALFTTSAVRNLNRLLTFNCQLTVFMAGRFQKILYANLWSGMPLQY